jgi:immunoglobulin-binding protein 1
LRHFISTLENYDVVPRTERELHEKSAPSISNAAARRELKIKQYQKENALRTRIQVRIIYARHASST